MSSPRAVGRMLRNDPLAFAAALALWVTFHLFPLATGWAFKLVLDRLTDGAAATSPWSMVAVLAGLELGRWALMLVSHVQFHGAWVGWVTLQRVNALSGLATSPGPVAGRLPSTSGEAVSRFRDDTHDIAMVADSWIDVTGSLLAAGGAVVVMLSIDVRVTIGVIVPVVAALGVASWLGPMLRVWRRAAREAGADVTGFIGDAFGSVLAVKAAGAEHAVASRFRALNDARAVVARRDQFGSQLFQSLAGATGQIGTGMLLVLVAQSARSGDFSVGEIGLFASYVEVLATLSRWVGRVAAYQRQADVSLDRLAELSPTGDRMAAVAPRPTYLRFGPPPLAAPPAADEPFEELRVEGLRMAHDGGRGVHGVDLVVRAGELVVLTGPVGSGKSTLLRSVLGLVGRDGGRIVWNGREVADPATFLVPPRVAYLPQVPRLFSEPLGDTVLLGLPDDGALDRALWEACLEDDVAEMPDGPRTVVGPKGVRLSGGQLQRTAAARALVRRPQLLVVDDLSSALDVETESRVWDRLLADGGLTALVVTHRPRVLAAADVVVVLDDGLVAISPAYGQ